MTTESFTDIDLATVDLATVDLSDLSYFQDGPPYELFARMRKEPGPHWNALTNADEPGFWSFTKFDDIATISGNPELFSSARGGVFFTATMGATPVEVLREVILGMDPPRHTHQRGVVQAVFTPRMIRQMEAEVRATVTTLIDNVIEKGACDFVEDIAVELPLIVIADLLGVVQDDRRQLFEWTNQLSRAAATGDAQMGLGALMEIGGYLTALTAERKANPGPDLLSRLLAAEVDGESLSEQEVTFFFAILMFAGNDTTRNTASGGMRALMENPAERQKLIDDPELIPGAVEEMLRWVSPVVYFTRTVTADTVVGGHALKEGERVAMWYGAGSRDPEKNANPETFDVSRGKMPHQAFGGGGPHFCLGNQLARLELRVLFEELVRRIPDMEISGPVARLVSSFSNELTSMPVTFTPGRRES
ncbi:cytochrome P450 [Mycolicibacterium mucogenicum]|jgi:linalool 8-monooxygenase|uniref:cytochrome P450 n=1 Tax=Mycolicibacterium mucogenicum TaxID=56689 RepID=UPI002269DC10|nr:cytochrome P450 [Mycolicibacterium mucogenicum]MCX8559919.1 cytochrome P450 [Mycolicibacterium mucogenicum]